MGHFDPFYFLLFFMPLFCTFALIRGGFLSGVTTFLLSKAIFLPKRFLLIGKLYHTNSKNFVRYDEILGMYLFEVFVTTKSVAAPMESFVESTTVIVTFNAFDDLVSLFLC